MKMAAEKQSWQSYNFPFSGQEHVSQSFIEYGSASVLNIDLDEDGQRLVIHSNQLHDSLFQRRLVAKHPSLPFLEPNQRCSSLPEETLNDYQLGGCLRRDQLNFNASTVHVDNFSADHPDVMYGTIVDLLQEEMSCPPWSTCGNNKHKIDVYFPWKRKDDCCKVCYNIRHASAHRNSNPNQILKHLGATLPDISPTLLDNLLQESNALEISRLHFDAFMGNSLTCHALEEDYQALLMYPSGPGLDILNFSHISHVPLSMVSATKECTSLPFHPVLLKQQFSVQGRIRQIDFSSYSYNNIVIGSRSQYNCTFLQRRPTGSDEGGYLALKLLETVALTRQAMCIAVSPYIPGESVIVTETGGTYLWSCGHSMSKICPGNLCERRHDYPWYQCVFADNPRCIAMADTKGMDLIDFRAGTLFRRFFFSIPSDQVDSFECISAIQRHPQNGHHYVLSTDQSLMILDDRFLQHPVLKWRHHNEDPVQFINVVCNAIPQCNDTIVMVSGSSHGQTHCFQYSDTAATITEPLPPKSTSSPWKVSPYNEWHYTGGSSDFTYSPVVASRLSQPLIGICTMRQTSHPQKGFTVFQLSSAGDLFYQPFISQDCRDSEEGHFWTTSCGAQSRQELGTEAKILCQKWIDMAAHQMNVLIKPTPCHVDYAEADKKYLCQDLFFLPAAHPSCVLCNDRQTERSSKMDQKQCDLSVCERCGLDVSYSYELVRNQKDNRVLTKGSLDIQHKVTDLGILPDFNKATDPLSKSLWVNWNSVEPVPVFSDEPTPVFSDDPRPVYSDNPVLVKSNKPANNNTSIPVNNKKPLVVFSSGEQEATTHNTEDTASESENLPLQAAVTSVGMPTVLPQGNKIPLDNDFIDSPSKQGVPSPSQLKPVENSSKKLKIVKKRTGHVMGF